MPDFFNVALAQRACRDFAADPVPDADVERMIEAATHAPSGENTQPWVFVVVRDEATRTTITTAMEQLWSQVTEGGQRYDDRPALQRDVVRGMTGGFATAPVLVVVAVDQSRAGAGSPSSSMWPAIQNLLLAANALGYGSALTTLGVYAADLAGLLDLPTSVRPVAVVPVGRPARPLGPPRRRPVSEVTHRERYGKGWSSG